VGLRSATDGEFRRTSRMWTSSALLHRAITKIAHRKASCEIYLRCPFDEDESYKSSTE
jgi:hypothetical protein